MNTNINIGTSEINMNFNIRITFINNPFFAATSFALLVKSPNVDLPTYVRSSKVFLLTAVAVLLASKADFEASCILLAASSAAFFACNVNCKSYGRLSVQIIYQHVMVILRARLITCPKVCHTCTYKGLLSTDDIERAR